MAKKKILLIDDDDGLLGMLREVMQKLGFDPILAGDGVEGMEKFKENNPDLCLVDIKMPKMDGMEFLEKAKEIDPKAIIIIMTGYPSAETIIETIENDGYTYVSKPFEIAKIKELVERGLRQREILTGS